MGGSLPRVRAAAQLSRVGLSEAAFPADSGQGAVKTSFLAILAKTATAPETAAQTKNCRYRRPASPPTPAAPTTSTGTLRTNEPRLALPLCAGQERTVSCDFFLHGRPTPNVRKEKSPVSRLFASWRSAQGRAPQLPGEPTCGVFWRTYPYSALALQTPAGRGGRDLLGRSCLFFRANQRVGSHFFGIGSELRDPDWERLTSRSSQFGLAAHLPAHLPRPALVVAPACPSHLPAHQPASTAPNLTNEDSRLRADTYLANSTVTNSKARLTTVARQELLFD